MQCRLELDLLCPPKPKLYIDKCLTSGARMLVIPSPHESRPSTTLLDEVLRILMTYCVFQ
jgi:hypothetical protein